MHQPFINALIATFLALGTANQTVHRAGALLRDLIADGVVDPETCSILESIITAAEADDDSAARDGDLFAALAAPLH